MRNLESGACTRQQRLALTLTLVGAVVGGCSGASGWTDRYDAQPESDASVDAALDASHDAAPDAEGGSGDAAADAQMNTDTGPQPDGASDSGDDSGIVESVCRPEDQVATGCMTLGSDSEQDSDLCDGLDNDCDGEVDEGCFCIPGRVQRCFAGPPGRVDVGACQWGTQVCEGFEFGSWGTCEGGLSPSTEQCDALDNDCNGCIDEIDECVSVVDCPGPGDPRIGRGAPFSTHTFNADTFVNPAAVKAYRWRIVGTPCDRMFRTLPGNATSTSGQLSYVLKNPNTAQASVDLTLSGEYAVTMEVDLKNGDTVSCAFPFQVQSKGLRVELCWPESGPNSPAAGEVDLDLHLGRADLTSNWNDAEDCHYSNCDTITQQLGSGSIWGYGTSPKANCTGPGASDVANMFASSCQNPRLDLDSANVKAERYPTENINLDAPGSRSFRVAVVNRGCKTDPLCQERIAHPLVNVYCDGELLGSHQLKVGQVDTFGNGSSGAGSDGERDLWRVVDIATTTVSGGKLDCALTPLTTPGEKTPWIETGAEEGSLPY